MSLHVHFRGDEAIQLQLGFRRDIYWLLNIQWLFAFYLPTAILLRILYIFPVSSNVAYV